MVAGRWIQDTGQKGNLKTDVNLGSFFTFSCDPTIRELTLVLSGISEISGAIAVVRRA